MIIHMTIIGIKMKMEIDKEQLMKIGKMEVKNENEKTM